VVVCPGRYHAREGLIYGAHAVSFLQAFNVNWAFVGSSGLTGDGDVTLTCVGRDSAAVIHCQAAAVTDFHSAIALRR
jgi:DeoR/GlpR family transcriptional regulator of sugar metabolism